MPNVHRPLDRSKPSRSFRGNGIICQSQTTWDYWSNYVETHRTKPKPKAADPAVFTEIAAAIKSVATNFKPTFVSSESYSNALDLKISELDDVDLDSLPNDLHEAMEAVGVKTLTAATGFSGKIPHSTLSYTTTDIDAAFSITGTVVNVGGSKEALVCMVATEPGQVSWSRLEGLILHWSCADSPSGAWTGPPSGWKALPAKSVDAGGAFQCPFEKHTVQGNRNMFVLLMQLPLKGILKSGGMVFVLKATQGATTRWLKNQATTKDFFVDFQKLPATSL